MKRGGRNFITHSELRRVYKLCKEFENGDLSEISEVAKKSIKFAKLTLDQDDKCRLEELPPFWENEDLNASWKLRKVTPKTEDKLQINSIFPKIIKWKEELVKQLLTFKENQEK